MMKTLRLLMLTLLMAVTGTAMAQEVTLDFTVNDWGLPESSSEKLTESKSFTNGTYSITLQGSSDGGYYFNKSDKYLLLGKKGATLTLPAFDFDVSSIVVVGRTGASGKVSQNFFVGENEVSTATTGATGENTYEILSAYQAAGNIYTLKVLNGNNTQITEIRIYKVGSEVVKPKNPEFKFDPTSLVVTIGDNNFTEPKLTYAEGFDGTVTYSIDPAGVASIDATNGKLTIEGVGTATVTAKSDATEKFDIGEASYTLTVKKKSESADPFHETFDQIEGTGGNDDAYAGQVAGTKMTTTDPTDETWVTLDYAYKGDKCAKFGTGSADGTMTTRAIELTGDGSLTFRAAGWGSGTNKLAVTATGATLDGTTNITLENGVWKEYTIAVNGGNGNVTISFTGKRGFIDDILVKSGAVSVQTKPELSFTPASLTVTIGQNFTEPVLNTPDDFTGSVTYSIEPATGVATIDAATGKLSNLAEGTATVTAKTSLTDKYLEGEVSYTLTVQKQTQNTEPFEETFDQIEGTGGNDDAYTGQVAGTKMTTTDPTNETWVALESIYKADKCAKFGTGSADGKMTTRAIGISGEGGLTFRAAGWGSGSNTLTVTVEGATLEGASKITLSNGEWKNYTLGLKNGNGNVTVTFEGKRGFIDDIMVKSGAVVIKKEAEFEFSSDKLDVTIGEDFIEPELKYAEGFDGTVTYSIEPATGVATIDAATGKLTIIAAGTATVTATSAETDNFYAGKASYLLSVVDAAVTYDIAGIKGIGDEKAGILKLENAQVLYKGLNDMYVKDASGAIDFFKTTNFSYETGQILNGTATVTFKNYNGLPEITAVADADVTATAGTATPTAVSDLADVTLEKYVCDLVTVTGTLKIDGKNYYVTDGTTDLMIYDKFNLFKENKKLAEAVEGSAVTATGIVVVFQNKPEVALTELDIESEIITVDISGAGFATLYYSDKNLKVPDGVTAFTCKANSATKTLESKEYSVIPAGSAVVLKAAQGSYSFVVTVTADEKDNENMLMGSDVAATTEAPREGDYKFFMLADDEELGVGFFPGAKNCGPFTSGAHKAYLAVPASMAADYYTFDFIDGIKGVTLPATINADSEIYTLSGMRVKASDLKKGVYIVNGSKIIIK